MKFLATVSKPEWILPPPPIGTGISSIFAFSDFDCILQIDCSLQQPIFLPCQKYTSSACIFAKSNGSYSQVSRMEAEVVFHFLFVLVEVVILGTHTLKYVSWGFLFNKCVLGLEHKSPSSWSLVNVPMRRKQHILHKLVDF